MRGFATSPNPYTTGTRPRSFLARRVEMLRNEQRFKKVEYNKTSKEVSLKLRKAA